MLCCGQVLDSPCIQQYNTVKAAKAQFFQCCAPDSHMQSELLSLQLTRGSLRHHMQIDTALPCCPAEARCSYPCVGVQEVLLQPHPVKRLKRSRGVSIHTPVVDVACGHWATYAVDEAGHVWAWGLNNYGQLGMPGQVRPTCAFLGFVHMWQVTW